MVSCGLRRGAAFGIVPSSPGHDTGAASALTLLANQLRTNLQIQRQEIAPRSQDDWTEESDRWTTIGSIRAKIERVNVAGMAAFYGYTITMRYRQGILPTDRLYDPLRDITYQIDSLTEDMMRGRWLIATAIILDQTPKR